MQAAVRNLQLLLWRRHAVASEMTCGERLHHVAIALYIHCCFYCLFVLFPFFAAPFNCSYPNPQVLPFVS